MSSSFDLMKEAGILVQAIEDAAVENDGDITEDDDMLEDYLERNEDKTLACLFVADSMKSEENRLRALEVKIAKRRRAISNRRAGILERVHGLRTAAEELGEDFKVKTSEYSVHLRKSASVQVADDLGDVDVRYLVEQDPTVDKKKAMADLKAGKELAGLSIKYNESLQWRLF